MDTLKIEAKYGMTSRYRLTLADDFGNAMNLSGCRFLSKIKSKTRSLHFLFEIDESDLDIGILTLNMPIIPVGSYIFDIVMTDLVGDIYPIVDGTIKILKGVTIEDNI